MKEKFSIFENWLIKVCMFCKFRENLQHYSHQERPRPLTFQKRWKLFALKVCRISFLPRIELIMKPLDWISSHCQSATEGLDFSFWRIAPRLWHSVVMFCGPGCCCIYCRQKVGQYWWFGFFLPNTLPPFLSLEKTYRLQSQQIWVTMNKWNLWHNQKSNHDFPAFLAIFCTKVSSPVHNVPTWIEHVTSKQSTFSWKIGDLDIFQN